MKYSNFHTHCMFCDGEGHPEKYVEEAISQGFDAIGFSSHSHIPCSPWTIKEELIDEYLHTINSLKFKYEDKIQVYTGLEIDYIPTLYGPRSVRFNILNLDYNIGSVHAILDEKSGELLSVDNTVEEFEKMLNNVFGGSIEQLVKEYYKRMREMAELHKPDIIGHFDLVKKNNKGGKYFNEDDSWYREEVKKTLEEVATSPCIIEINTGGMSRNYTDTFYPSPWIIKECKKLDIPVMINSDAHDSKSISAYFDQAVIELKDSGYTKQRILYNGEWVDIDL